MKIKDIVKNNAQTYFQFYRDGEFYYKTDSGFEYNISIDETKGASFKNQDRAFTHMRWIRKRLELLSSLLSSLSNNTSGHET